MPDIPSAFIDPEAEAAKVVPEFVSHLSELAWRAGALAVCEDAEPERRQLLELVVHQTYCWFVCDLVYLAKWILSDEASGT